MQTRSRDTRYSMILTFVLVLLLVLSAIVSLAGCADDTVVNNTSPAARNMYLEIYYDNGSRIELRQYSCSLFKADPTQVYITTDTGVVTLDKSKVVGHECKPQ
jgi:hypothetical protein